MDGVSFNIIQNISRFFQQLNFLNIWLQVHIQFIVQERGSVFPAILLKLIVLEIRRE